MLEEYYVECINENCGWEGMSTQCVKFKHDDSGRIWCPECHDAVEPRQCDEPAH